MPSAGQEAQGRLKEYDTVGTTLGRGRHRRLHEPQAQSQPRKAGRRPVEEGVLVEVAGTALRPPSLPVPCIFQTLESPVFQQWLCSQLI